MTRTAVRSVAKAVTGDALRRLVRLPRRRLSYADCPQPDALKRLMGLSLRLEIREEECR